MLELTDKFIPQRFLFREGQYNQIKKIFSDFKEDRYMATNLIILGTTGAGKTSMIRKIINEQDNNLFVSAMENKTTNRILKALSGKKLCSDSELIQCLVKLLNENPKILIIDEVGKIQDPENFCNTLNAIYRLTNVPIIVITNKWTFIEEMPDDAKLTLFFNKVEFPSYSAIQLKEILKERLVCIREKTDFDFSEGSLEYLSAKIIKEHFGSVRTALVILNQCVTARDDSIKFINEKIEYIETQEWESFLHKLSSLEKDFLNIILELAENEEEIPSTDIANRMKGLASPSKISQIITSFIDYGIIKAKWKHLGRAGGKHRIISFSKPEYRTKLLKLLSPWEGNDEGNQHG